MQKQELPKSEECLNCGHKVHEHKYCPGCGQENLDYRVKLNVLIRYYISKYLRFDIKWLNTIKVLLLRPWQLTEVYLEGKRKKYTHPFRLYLVLSVVFFLGLRLQIDKKTPDKGNKRLNLSFLSIETQNEVNMQRVIAQVMAQLPNAMLISLPLIALLLAALYYKKKNYIFFDHFILMLHYYAYVYLISLPALFIPKIPVFFPISMLLSNVYLWLTMKRFYKENIFITSIKYLLFSLFSLVIILILSILLFILIVLKETFLTLSI